jgi:hypothetical protein
MNAFNNNEWFSEHADYSLTNCGMSVVAKFPIQATSQVADTVFTMHYTAMIREPHEFWRSNRCHQ